jgi:GTP diphosphokinase / guanosine-3',5'-bis(diphosphate) 3'-diphosphatase
MAHRTNGNRQKIQIQPSINWSAFQSHVRYLSMSEQKRVKEAFHLGQEVHEGQVRLSGDPYFSHCIAVANLLADMYADSDTIISAFLHDTIEDTEFSPREIEKRFGNSVFKLVEGLTKLSAEEFIEHPTLNEQIETIRKIFTLMQEDARIMVIKLVDRLHNMQTIEFLQEERRIALAKETLDIYVKIADRFCMQDVRDELEELCLNVLSPDLLGQLMDLRAQGEKLGKKLSENISKNLRSVQPPVPVNAHYEHKVWSRLRAYLETGGSAASGISAFTMVFVCDSDSACYRILGALHQCWEREELSFRDFINSPGINGYRGLHTTVILEDGTRVRCKIRTRDMQEYARNGITTKCFDGKAIGLPDYLPWADRISPLAKDTSERSQDFWDSLQSDILGESIVIHGPADQKVLLPEGATALDAAFYLFGDMTLRITSLSINGVESSLQSEVIKGVTIDATFGKRKTVKHEWLQWVQTGLSAAHIHSELAKQLPEKKIAIGKEMLQEIMKEKKKGLIEEFQEESLRPGLSSIGAESVDSACIAIAEGRLDPAEVYKAFFEEKKKNAKSPSDRQDYIVRLKIRVRDMNAVHRLVDVWKKYNSNFRGVRVWPIPFTPFRRFSISMNLSSKESEVIQKDVKNAGGEDVYVFPKYGRWKYVAGVALVLLLWGLDPVFARLLVADYGVSPADLTLIRFGSLTLLSGFFLTIKILQGELKKETAITLKSRWLWFSAVLLVLVAWSTYASLSLTWPSHYSIPMTMAGLLLTTAHHVKKKTTVLATWSLFMLGLLVLVAGDPTWSSKGMFLTALAVISFTIFTVVSARHKKKEGVSGRVLQYFFVLSCLCLLLSLPLLQLNTIAEMSMGLITGCVLFSVFISALPYYLYFYALSRQQFNFILRYSFLIVFITIAGQFLIYRNILWTPLLAAAFVIVGALMPTIMRSHSKSEN